MTDMYRSEMMHMSDTSASGYAEASSTAAYNFRIMRYTALVAVYLFILGNIVFARISGIFALALLFLVIFQMLKIPQKTYRS